MGCDDAALLATHILRLQDDRHLRAVGGLLIAMSHGPEAIDEWIIEWDGEGTKSDA